MPLRHCVGGTLPTLRHMGKRASSDSTQRRAQPTVLALIPQPSVARWHLGGGATAQRFEAFSGFSADVFRSPG
jgi:hypothetical protein